MVLKQVSVLARFGQCGVEVTKCHSLLIAYEKKIFYKGSENKGADNTDLHSVCAEA